MHADRAGYLTPLVRGKKVESPTREGKSDESTGGLRVHVRKHS